MVGDLDVPDNGRETCVVCGMVANVDPSLHTERYGHAPEVRRDGRRYRFDFQTYTFRTLVGDGS